MENKNLLIITFPHPFLCKEFNKKFLLPFFYVLLEKLFVVFFCGLHAHELVFHLARDLIAIVLVQTLRFLNFKYHEMYT